MSFRKYTCVVESATQNSNKTIMIQNVKLRRRHDHVMQQDARITNSSSTILSWTAKTVAKDFLVFFFKYKLNM